MESSPSDTSPGLVSANPGSTSTRPGPGQDRDESITAAAHALVQAKEVGSVAAELRSSTHDSSDPSADRSSSKPHGQSQNYEKHLKQKLGDDGSDGLTAFGRRLKAAATTDSIVNVNDDAVKSNVASSNAGIGRVYLPNACLNSVDDDVNRLDNDHAESCEPGGDGSGQREQVDSPTRTDPGSNQDIVILSPAITVPVVNVNDDTVKGKVSISSAGDGRVCLPSASLNSVEEDLTRLDTTRAGSCEPGGDDSAQRDPVAGVASSDTVVLPPVSPRRSPRIQGMREQPSLSRQLRLDDASALLPSHASPRNAARAAPSSGLRDRSQRMVAMFGSPASSEQEEDDEEDDEDDGDKDASDSAASSGRESEESEASEHDQDQHSASTSSDGDDDSDQDSGDDTSHDRTRPALTQDCPKAVKKAGYPTNCVRVVPPRLNHKNWKSFSRYLGRYCEETHQVIPVKETMNCKEKNSRIAKTVRGRNGKAPRVPASWGFFQKTFICTHGWDRDGRGGGTRPRQFVNGTGCPFRFVVQMQSSRSGKKSKKSKKADKKSDWFLQVKNGFFGHNHPVNTETYSTYPVARGIRSPTTAAQLATMIEAKTPRTLMLDLCIERGENVFKRDVDNLIPELKALATPGDEDDATALVLGQFASPLHNSVSVAENQMGESGVISMTSAHMRSIYARFPQLLMIDTTHKTNRHNYQLLTFMTMDEFGAGRVVQHSLLETNSDWHMHKALDHFFATQENTKLLRVIVVDKDLNEIRVLKKRFPEVRILICSFHVIKYLWEKCRKPEFGKHSTEDLEQIDAFIHKMLNAESAAVYDENLEALKGLCTRMHNLEFLRYFETNWNTEASKDMWVYFRRAHLPHFRNHTNNRLESFFGKLKKTLKSSFTMPECLRKIIAHGKRVENEYRFQRNRQGHPVNRNYDKEMSAVLRYTTHFVAERIEPEYAAGLAKAHVYQFTPEDGDVFAVQGEHSLHLLNIADYRCDCAFAQSMLLPCRHAIAYNKHYQVPGAVVPQERIDQRWRKETKPPTRIAPIRYTRFCKEELRLLTKKRTREERYVSATQATTRIASELAEVSDEEEFGMMLQWTIDQWRNIRQRKRLGIDSKEVASHSPKRRRVEAKSSESAEDDSDDDEAKNSGDGEGGSDGGGSDGGSDGDDGDDGEGSDGDGEEDSAGSQEENADSRDDGGADADDDVEATQEAQPPSQAHSLYSEELDEVARVDTSLVRFDPPDELMISQSQLAANDIAAIKIEKAKKTKATRASEATKAKKAKVTSKSDIQIRLNRKAVRPGRPSLDQKKERTKTKIARQRATASQVARVTCGEVTLSLLADSLERDMPDLDELTRRLSGLEVRHEDFNTSKPKKLKQKKPVLNSDAFYLLPRDLLKACINVLGVENSLANAIWLTSQLLADEDPPERLVDVVTIPGIKGAYSRHQIETMKRLSDLKKVAESGIELCKWLVDDVVPVVKEAEKKEVKNVAAHIRAQYPTRIVPGLGDRAEYCFSMLYRVQPPEYLNDAIINAACKRLCDDFPYVRHAGTPDARPGSARTNTQKMPSTMSDRVKSYMLEGNVDIVVVPVNFGNAHWCGIVVDTQAKEVVYYDSLNQANYTTTLKKLSMSIKTELVGFSIRQMETPIQFDGFSCGLYVLYFFFNYIAVKAKVMSKGTLDLRRWELLQFVLYGRGRIVDVASI